MCHSHMQNFTFATPHARSRLQWYKAKREMKKQYGAFPLFWQDLKAWEPWPEVRKAYMIDTEDTSREAVIDTPADKTEDIAAIAEAAEVAPAIKALMGDLGTTEGAPAATEAEASIGDVRDFGRNQCVFANYF